MKQAGPKKKEKQGHIAGRDHKSQATEAAKIAKKRNKGKMRVRINSRTEILILPNHYAEIKKKYGLIDEEE